MKLILLIIVMFFACGVAMLLIARLQKTQQRLADLHAQLASNEEKLTQQRLDLDKLAAASPPRAEDTQSEIKS